MRSLGWRLELGGRLDSTVGRVPALSSRMDDPFAGPQSHVGPPEVPVLATLARAVQLVLANPLGAAIFVMLQVPGELIADTAWGVGLSVFLGVAVDPFSTAYWFTRARGDAAVPFALVRERWVAAVLLGALVSSVMMLGIVLLIVPGIYIGARWSFVTAFVVLERQGLSALRSSSALVRGRSLPVVIAIVIGVLVSAVAHELGRRAGDASVLRYALSLIAALFHVGLTAWLISLYVAMKDADAAYPRPA